MFPGNESTIIPWNLVDWSLNKVGEGANKYKDKSGSTLVTHATNAIYYDVDGTVHNKLLNNKKDKAINHKDWNNWIKDLKSKSKNKMK